MCRISHFSSGSCTRYRPREKGEKRKIDVVSMPAVILEQPKVMQIKKIFSFLAKALLICKEILFLRVYAFFYCLNLMFV